jgi:hypothetical protein
MSTLVPQQGPQRASQHASTGPKRNGQDSHWRLPHGPKGDPPPNHPHVTYASLLEKLTYTSALRLYRLPNESQLLKRLGPNWHDTGYGDTLTLLPVRVDRTVNSRILRPTVLEALAQRVPSWGPRVDVVAVSPWEVPNWVAHLTYMGVVRPHLRKAWIRDLSRLL